MLLLTLFACNGDDPGTPPPDDFNYIPDYGDACMPTATEAPAVAEIIDDAIVGDTFLVADHFEICGDSMTSSCAPCSLDPSGTDYNAMAHMLSEFDDWGSAETQATLAASGVTPDMFPGMFEQALGYPWRHLLVHGQDGSTSFTLSPGVVNTCTLDDSCAGGPEMQVAFEALDAECADFQNTVTGSFALTSGSATVSTSTPGDHPFGFQVPLVAPSDLRPVSDFESVPQLEAWLTSQLRATVQVDEPQIDISTADGQTCGRITGFVETSTFQDIRSSDDALDDYADASGRIPITLTIELHETAVEAPAI